MSLVLIADDDPDILELVRARLERAGCEVMAAADGLEAVALAEARPPALAVLDVSMPGMTGWEVTRRLRATPATATIPIVILTAAAQDSDVTASMEAGATAHIRKPFSPRDLVAQVQRLLSGEGTSPA